MNQNMKALEKANIHRTARAALKWEILKGEKTVVAVLMSPPIYLEHMPIMELLTAQNRWGRTRARKILYPHMIGENVQIGNLTTRQRKLLITELS